MGWYARISEMGGFFTWLYFFPYSMHARRYQKVALVV